MRSSQCPAVSLDIVKIHRCEGEFRVVNYIFKVCKRAATKIVHANDALPGIKHACNQIGAYKACCTRNKNTHVKLFLELPCANDTG